MKIILENIFKWLVAFWKCYFLTNFSLFLNFQNKYNNRKIQYINLNETKIKTKHSLNSKIQSNGERGRKRVIDNWGKGRGRSRKREIEHGWVMGAILPVLGCDLSGASGGAISAVLQVARSRKCWGSIFVELQVARSRRCWGATRSMRSGVGSSGAI